MQSVAENVERVQSAVRLAAERSERDPACIRLVAVTKTVDVERIRAAHAAGVREFGENYLQEALGKFPGLCELSFSLHFIGHLQRNKAGKAAQYFDMVQSIDSLPLAERLAKAALQQGRTIQTLIEVNVSGEAAKSGVAPGDVPDLAGALAGLEGIGLKGLMGMGPLDGNESDTRYAFKSLAKMFSQLPEEHRQVLSMGMSGDFTIAIEEGSTMVRIGSSLFGARRMSG